MIEIRISDEQRKRADELYEFNILKGSVTKGEGNKVGALGEIVVLDRFKGVSEYFGDYDYDLIIKGKKVDVKTKKQNMRPASHHSVNIFSYNTKQKCDYYCFVLIHSSLKFAWIVGWMTKDDFYEKARFRKKGEIDDTLATYWKFRDDCYTMKITDLVFYDEKVKD